MKATPEKIKLIANVLQERGISEGNIINRIRRNRAIIEEIDAVNTPLGILIEDGDVYITKINQSFICISNIDFWRSKRRKGEGGPRKEPLWKIRIKKNIESYRKELSMPKEYRNKTAPLKVLHKAHQLFKNENHGRAGA